MKRPSVVLLLAGALLWLLVSVRGIVESLASPELSDTRLPNIHFPEGVVTDMAEQEIREIAYQRYRHEP